jgi:hypothetical protein
VVALRCQRSTVRRLKRRGAGAQNPQEVLTIFANVGLVSNGNMALDVSVPCRECEAPIRFGDRRCYGCGATVTRSLRRSLNERLEATGGEFGEMRKLVHDAANVMLFVGVLHVAHLFLRLWLAASAPVDAPEAIGIVLVFCFCALMFAGAFLVDYAPKQTVQWVLVGYLFLEYVTWQEMPKPGLLGLLLKCLIVFFLIRALIGVNRADALKRDLLRLD